MAQLSPLERNILLSCNDDYTGLWEAIRDAEDAHAQATPEDVQRITLEAIAGLLEKGLILAGFPRRGGVGFDAWDLPNDQIIKRIEHDWNALGQEPTIGDVVWFVSTIEGDRLLAEGKPRITLEAHEEEDGS